VAPLRFIVEMNRSPGWVPLLAAAGWPSAHWSSIGAENADDVEIMAWCRSNAHAALTEDLDFGRLLSLTQPAGPSVVQLRLEDVLPDVAGPQVVAEIGRHAVALQIGALVVIDTIRSIVRILPI
jgi:predicted nuclease of predicted toxin-antitoxin system